MVQCISLGPDRSIRSIASLNVWSFLPSSPKIRSVAYLVILICYYNPNNGTRKGETDLLDDISHDAGTQLFTCEPEVLGSLYEFIVILRRLARDDLRLNRGRCPWSLSKGDLDWKTSAQG